MAEKKKDAEKKQLELLRQSLYMDPAEWFDKELEVSVCLASSRNW